MLKEFQFARAVYEHILNLYECSGSGIHGKHNSAYCCVPEHLEGTGAKGAALTPRWSTSGAAMLNYLQNRTFLNHISCGPREALEFRWHFEEMPGDLNHLPNSDAGVVAQPRFGAEKKIRARAFLGQKVGKNCVVLAHEPPLISGNLNGGRYLGQKKADIAEKAPKNAQEWAVEAEGAGNNGVNPRHSRCPIIPTEGRPNIPASHVCADALCDVSESAVLSGVVERLRFTIAAPLTGRGGRRRVIPTYPGYLPDSFAWHRHVTGVQLSAACQSGCVCVLLRRREAVPDSFKTTYISRSRDSLEMSVLLLKTHLFVQNFPSTLPHVARRRREREDNVSSSRDRPEFCRRQARPTSKHNAPDDLSILVASCCAEAPRSGAHSFETTYRAPASNVTPLSVPRRRRRAAAPMTRDDTSPSRERAAHFLRRICRRQAKSRLKVQCAVSCTHDGCPISPPAGETPPSRIQGTRRAFRAPLCGVPNFGTIFGFPPSGFKLQVVCPGALRRYYA
ncbi:hypothetical protein DFH06DRAFT_1138491 [Mycena polygramma]|nr:hypothetical protein DFH06DRAFT_1138491 [Mycena polygramma]